MAEDGCLLLNYLFLCLSARLEASMLLRSCKDWCGTWMIGRCSPWNEINLMLNASQWWQSSKGFLWKDILVVLQKM
ncbi:uncharacterized protein [Setaria viridis]|uniref:uncharacterized protein isoform X4 n=1 Tax=Setaria viridis TaxID=4556 RepID=UPI0014934622|nr:uncharacterized protein LOC117847888 isoform X5 [Setaria viridis]